MSGMRAKTFSNREWDSVLYFNLFREIRRHGSHRIFVDSYGRVMTVPINVNKMMARRLIKDYDLKMPDDKRFSNQPKKKNQADSATSKK